MQLGARPHLERQQGPLAPRGFERSYMRYSGAYLAHLHHRPGPDKPEPVVKSDSLLTNQPCECTLTAVGPVKVLVLHGARQRLADYRAEEADREIREPSTAPLPLEAHTYFEYDRGETNVRHMHEILKKIMKMTAIRARGGGREEGEEGAGHARGEGSHILC